MKFIKPAQTNGFQLKKELAAVGIQVDDVWDDGDGFLSIDIDKSLEDKATEVIKNHVGIDPEIEKNRKRQEILDKLGITQDEAKLLLA